MLLLLLLFDDQVCGQSLRASVIEEWGPYRNHGEEFANLVMHSTHHIVISKSINPTILQITTS